nr:hypothetical protein [Deltaproteobacteria bacterium]
MTAVQAREAGTPDGEEPLDWLLLTTFPVHTLDDAIRVTAPQRWLIERLHYVEDRNVRCGEFAARVLRRPVQVGHP